MKEQVDFTTTKGTVVLKTILSLKWKYMGLTRSGRWMRIITSFSSPHSRLCSAAPLPTSVRQVILGVFKCAASQYSLTVWTSCHYQCIPLKPKLISANWINLSLFLQWSPFTVSSKFQEREDSPRSVKGCFGTPTFGKCTWETRSFPMPWKSRRLSPFPGSHFTTLTVPCWCRCVHEGPTPVACQSGSFQHLWSIVIKQEQCSIYTSTLQSTFTSSP